MCVIFIKDVDLFIDYKVLVYLLKIKKILSKVNKFSEFWAALF